MKTKTLYLLLILGITSCFPEQFPEIGEPLDRVNMLSGTWQVNLVIQNDEDAIRKGFPVALRSKDITEVFAFTDFQLTLNLVDGKPGDFSVTEGNSPNIIGGLTSGTWSLDSNEFPSLITFVSGNETYTIEIGSFAELEEDKLELKIQRTILKSGEQEAYMTYDYEFIKL